MHKVLHSASEECNRYIKDLKSETFKQTDASCGIVDGIFHYNWVIIDSWYVKYQQ